MTLPSIPDSVSKFLLLVGVILIGYSYFQYLNDTKVINSQVLEYNANQDSLTIKELIQANEKENLKKAASNLSQEYNLPNLILDKDSTMILEMITKGSKKQLFGADSLRKLWVMFKALGFQNYLFSEKINMLKDNLQKAKDDYKSFIYTYLEIGIMGIVFFILGLIGAIQTEKLKDAVLFYDIKQKKPKYTYCQSCGRNFTSMRVNGKDSNGELNLAFCNECYDNGSFKEPDLAFEELRKRIDILQDIKKSKKEKRRFLKKLMSLERWRKDEYFNS